VLLDWFGAQPLLGSRLPVSLLTKAQKAAELQRVVAAEAMTTAYKAELIMGLADDTPDTIDPQPGTPGARTGSWAPDTELPGVSEFFTHELAMVLNCGRGTANHLAHRAWVLRENLPATWAALADGVLDEARARALTDVLGTAQPAIARAVEAQLLPGATGLSGAKLKKLALAKLLELDAEAVDRSRAQARKSADVRTYPSPLEGMSTLATDLPAEEAAACYDLVDRLAAMLKADGDPRPIGELRAAVLSQLIRRPADNGLPAVTAHLQVTAPLATLTGRSDEPGAVDGHPITAAHLRTLLEQLDALCPGGLQAPTDGTLALAITDTHGRLLATVTRDRLERLVHRGCAGHPDEDCDCPLLDRPTAVDRYAPTDAQRAWVKTRDRTCRFPNCARQVGWADLDHVIPHSCGGRTDCANLCCLCRSHHRLKTFGHGWRFVMTPDGLLSVTTPSGITRTTHPPGLRRPPPEPPTGTRPPPGRPDHDPPPF
jgi:hypothetical protein